MKVLLKDLHNIADEKVYQVDISSYVVNNNLFLRRIEDVKGDVSFYYNGDELRVNYELIGNMICPDAITLEDVIVPFDLCLDDKVTYKQDEEGFFLERDMEIEELALFIIMPEAPIKVVKNEKIEYSNGDGWSFVSEADYKANKLDPRLQKLSEYKNKEDK